MPRNDRDWIEINAVLDERGRDRQGKDQCCLVIDNTRVAGCKPLPVSNNVRYTWNVEVAELRRILEEHDKK